MAAESDFEVCTQPTGSQWPWNTTAGYEQYCDLAKLVSGQLGGKKMDFMEDGEFRTFMLNAIERMYMKGTEATLPDTWSDHQKNIWVRKVVDTWVWPVKRKVKKRKSSHDDNGQGLRWCITGNNLVDRDVWLEHFELYGGLFKRYVLGFEVGESGTPHAQGAVVFTSNQRADAVRKIFPGCHIEMARSTWKKMSEYILNPKEDKRKLGPVDIVVHKPGPDDGKEDGSGKRNDILRAVEDVFSGAIDNEMDFCQTHTGTWARCRHLYSRTIMMKARIEKRDKHRCVEPWLFVGKAGTGKTCFAFTVFGGEDSGDWFKLDVDKAMWFDGYCGEAGLIIDEFPAFVAGQVPPISYAMLLKILDRYVLTCPVKGATVAACWTGVIITSNCRPDKWYSPDQDISALLDRLGTNIRVFNGPSLRKRRKKQEGPGPMKLKMMELDQAGTSTSTAKTSPSTVTVDPVSSTSDESESELPTVFARADDEQSTTPRSWLRNKPLPSPPKRRSWNFFSTQSKKSGPSLRDMTLDEATEVDKQQGEEFIESPQTSDIEFIDASSEDDGGEGHTSCRDMYRQMQD